MDFNAKEHLAAVRGKYHEQDFSEANTTLMAALAGRKCKPGAIANNLSLLACQAGVPNMTGGDLSDSESDDIPELCDDSDSEYDSDSDASSEDSDHPDLSMLSNLESSPETLFYGEIPSDDPFENEGADVGVEEEGELEAAINEMLMRSKDKCSPAGFERLKEIVHKHKKVWALKLGSQPPSKLPPMTIDLKPGANKPLRLPPRSYSPPQLEFMKTKIAELESLGLVYRNPTATWASPPHIVPKAGPEKFRFTVDLRAVNASTVPRT